MQTHYDKEGDKLEKKVVERRHSHRSIAIPNVIDQLKSKYKRKTLAKANSFDLSDSVTDTNSKRQLSLSSTRYSDHQIEISPVTLISYQPSRSPPKTLETIISCDGRDPNTVENLDPSIEMADNLVFDSLETKEENDKILSQTSSLPIEVNQKPGRRKSMSIIATKSLPESNIKKRRQTLRRTGFQIRDEDFNVIFSDLPANEQFIIGYPCAWRKEVFMHGRMFLTVNYICFYTCFFKWEESLCVQFTDIVSVTREKSAVVISNAIKIRTKSDEQYLFASYVPREKIFITIFRLWQNALLEQPLDYQQLRTLILADQQSIDESTGDSEESNNSEASRELTRDSSSLVMSKNSSDKSLGNTRRVKSLPADNEKVNYLSTCPCESHLLKTFADQTTFTSNVDTLFELLFGNNSFTQNYHSEQNLNDFNYGEWKLNKETGCRERLVTYKTVTQALIGSSSLSCREKQTLKLEKPGSIYILYSEVYNEGIKYADTFYVATQFCMIQKDPEHSSLRATAELRYIKNVNSLIKTFIEKNAYSTIEEQINEQIRRLTSQEVKTRSNKKQKHLVKQQSFDTTQEPIETTQESIETNTSISPSIQNKSFTGQGFIYDLILCIGVFVLFLHIFLCFKLYSIDQRIITPEALCQEQCRQSCLANSFQ